MNKSMLIILGMILGILVGGGAGYLVGHAKGKNVAYSQGHDAGYANAKKDFEYQINGFSKVLTDNSNLTNQYNSLVGQYNDLRNAVIKYVGATSYTSRTPISCTTYTGGLSNFTTTNCY